MNNPPNESCSVVVVESIDDDGGGRVRTRRRRRYEYVPAVPASGVCCVLLAAVACIGIAGAEAIV